MSLKQKTISGVIWSSIDNFAKQGIVFIVGIILARLLEPEDFGLIGMIAIFIAVSETIVRSGFTEALIRKNNCTQADYSTVFYYNLVVGVFFYVVLYFFSPSISRFFEEPQLKSILRVLSLILIINSISIIQMAILTKRVDFKLLTRVSIFSSGISGILAIYLAYKGFGVWSLVVMRLVMQGLNSLFLWVWNKWRPSLLFSIDSFRELFGFGSKLLASGLLHTIYENVYYLIIGKYFSAAQLGYFTRAKLFSDFPSRNINMVMGRVTYPILAQIQDDPEKLREAYRRIIKSIMYITFALMLGLSAVAEPLILTLIGEKWRQSIIYLQLFCFASMLYPLHALNLNMLKVKGRSDLFLKLEIIKKLLAIPVIVIGVVFGIKYMIIGLIFNSFIGYFLNSYWSGKLIGYSSMDQVKDITPSFLLSAGMALMVYGIGHVLDISQLLTLILQTISGAIIFFSISELIKMKDYIYLKQIVLQRRIKK